jgi:MFS family permease
MASGSLFYGWWVTIAFAVMVLLSTGVRFAVGPFLKPMVADLGTDRAAYSLVVSLSLFIYGVFMPFVGRLVERWGARPVVVLGILVFAASLGGTGLVTQLWQLALVYGVRSAVVSRWFIRRRATALSLLGAASMAGMSLVVPVAMWLILTVGWRAAYGIIGLGAAIVLLPLALWVIRESPEAMGLVPDGLALEPTMRDARADERTAVSDAARTAPFWQLCGGLFTCGFSMSLLSAHGVPMLTDHGYHAMLASSAIGVLGASSFAGAMILGTIADRFGRRPVLAWLYGTRTVLFAAMFLVHDSSAGLLVISALGGASMSGTLAMTSALTADIFGRFSVGSVFGTIFVVHQGGAALGSWLGGFLFELTGGYGATFAIACTQLLVAAVVSLTIDERARCGPRLHPVAAAP